MPRVIIYQWKIISFFTYAFIIWTQKSIYSCWSGLFALGTGTWFWFFTCFALTHISQLSSSSLSRLPTFDWSMSKASTQLLKRLFPGCPSYWWISCRCWLISSSVSALAACPLSSWITDFSSGLPMNSAHFLACSCFTYKVFACVTLSR